MQRDEVDTMKQKKHAKKHLVRNVIGVVLAGMAWMAWDRRHNHTAAT